MPIEENKQSFIKRFLIYQKERFNFLQNSLFLSAFSFSAISYSRICRGAEGFISLKNYIIATITIILLFFLLRIADEFKDKKDDAQFRPYLPVPRGLISLKELTQLAYIAIAFIVIINVLFIPQILLLLWIPVLFFILMLKEFFVSDWLRHHWPVYVISHMFFFPAVDIYSSGMDWFIEANTHAPMGLVYFFAVSFTNGLVWEVGRKIKSPENEEHNSYTTKYGLKKAVWIWIIIISLAYALSLLAIAHVNYGFFGVILLTLVYLSSVIYGLEFLKHQTAKTSQHIEISSGVWGLLMYIILGALPWLFQTLKM